MRIDHLYKSIQFWQCGFEAHSAKLLHGQFGSELHYYSLKTVLLPIHQIVERCLRAFYATHREL